MAARPSSTVAAVLLLVGIGLLANPLYLHSPPDQGSLLVGADRTAPADGAADLSPAIERSDDLQPIARYAARHAFANGSFTVDRSAPPLALQLFASQWRYLGSQRQTAVYRTTVTVEENVSTLRVANVSLHAVEAELGVTPPGRLNETDHPKEIAWLAHQSDAVVVIGEFASPWEQRLDTVIDRGRLTISNGNNASTFRPLGDRVQFIAHENQFYRVTLNETDAEITLTMTSVRNRTALSETNVSVVAATGLPSDVRPVVLEAIAADDGYVRTSHEDINTSRLGTLQERLIRHEGAYYVLRRGHTDDFDLTPLFRLILTGLGIIAVLIGLGIEWRARNR